MNKVFLYLYPIEEYTKMFLFRDDSYYDKWNIKRPLPILNECIQKRYRDHGFQVVFALYPDRNIYGIVPKPQDKIIYTDVTFEQASACYSDGTPKKDFVSTYPNEFLLLNQLGTIEELVIGGYHFSDCVKRVGETAFKIGIDTMIDIDLTDLFFSIYRKEDYFMLEEYNPQRYQNYWQKELEKQGERKSAIERQFQLLYDSPIYRFEISNHKKESIHI